MLNLYYPQKIVSVFVTLLFSIFLTLHVIAQTVVPFSYTGSMQTWTVPHGVTSITIDAGGGQGGGDATNTAHALGGRVQATMSVTGGQVLNIYIGGAGGDGSLNTASAAAGGFNGGGTGGYYSTVPPGYSGGGGGGATDIRLNGTALSDRILVAGGGGGSGYTASPKAGGAGGGTTGADGNTASGISAATGATTSAGGSGGTFGGQPNGSNGTLGNGGNASTGNGIPGGGGGGYYGGGGGGTTGAGPGGGGGGGSSYTNPSLTSVTHTQGYNSGNGYLTITYTPSLPLLLLSFNASKVGETIQTTWTTTDEINIATFQVEKSIDGNSFNVISQLPAKNIAGNHGYTYTDNNPSSGVNFYRLKIIDIDGSYKYSQVASVSFNGKASSLVQVYPNPGATNNIKLKMLNIENGKYLLELYNITGSLIHKSAIVIEGNQYNQSLSLPADINPGSYTISLKKGQLLFSQKITIQ